MMAMVTLGLLVLLAPEAWAGVGGLWNYDVNTGPENWVSLGYPDCGKRMQSPINIKTDDAIYDEDLTNFDLSNLSNTEGITFTLENVQGHTAEVFVGGKKPTISGGPLSDTFVLDQFHFHWGKSDDRGSEHQINGKYHSMEMHIVFHSQQYNSSSVASLEPHGLAVLGFFLEVVSDDNPSIENLLKYFDNITNPDDSVRIPTFPIDSLLPEDRTRYYYYQGSLTTPPCYETVSWTVFDPEKPIEISERQLEKFHSLRHWNLSTNTTEEIGSDFRTIQELHNRIVVTTIPPSGTLGAQTVAASFFGTLTAVLLSLVASMVFS